MAAHNRFAIPIVDHCNLNCRSCGNFAPLAQPTFLDVNGIKDGLVKLAELTNADIDINIYGGEPLLHPKLLDIVRSVRQLFPRTDITITTNGTLLQQRHKYFWQTLRDNNVAIIISHYPCLSKYIDKDIIKLIANHYGTQLHYITEEPQKMYDNPLDLSGQQDINQNWLWCSMAKICPANIRGNIVYGCYLVAFVHHFNTYFNQQVPVVEQDYKDITTIQSMDELVNFLSNPIPFCKFCKVPGNTNTDKVWTRSERKIEEWTT